MKILVYTTNYPSPTHPQRGTFVYRIVQEFVQLGNEVRVIAPQKPTVGKKAQTNYGEELAHVIRPQHLSLSNKKIGKFSTLTLSIQSGAISSRRAIKKMTWEPDVIYCHFLISAFTYVKAFPNETNPIFVAVGEYTWIDHLREHISDKEFNAMLGKVTGFIAVSPMIKDKLIAMGVNLNKIKVEPNGTDLEQFKPRDKTELREKYTIPQDKKIVLYVGNFLESKGAYKAAEALDYLEDDVRAIFLGKGTIPPQNDKILFTGMVPNKVVAEYMALADIFLLPSLNEGSSNVIVEAMASGLPIVSSDIPEIRVQCTPEFSFLVNPTSILEISTSLKIILENDNLRKKMSIKALEHSKKFDVRDRAQRVLKFIENKR